VPGLWREKRPRLTLFITLGPPCLVVAETAGNPSNGSCRTDPVRSEQRTVFVPMADEQPGAQQMMQMMQQKLGNLELTVHALLSVLDEKDMIDEETINDEAEKIVEEMQEERQDLQEEGDM